MIKKVITGLREVYENYDVFFIDLWGVMHNGIQLYSGAIEALENLHKLKKRFVLMSNAPRPSKNVEQFLLKLKMDKIYSKNIFTSGEAALKSLKQNWIIIMRIWLKLKHRLKFGRIPLLFITKKLF